MSGLVPFNRNNGAMSNHFNSFYDMIDDFFSDIMPAKFFATDNFKMDVSENEKEYIVEAELPGVKKDELGLEFEDGRLTIQVKREEEVNDSKGKYIHKERRYGSMERSVYLADVNGEAAEAVFENGILKITVPKLEKKEKTKKIDIKEL